MRYCCILPYSGVSGGSHPCKWQRALKPQLGTEHNDVRDSVQSEDVTPAVNLL